MHWVLYLNAARQVLYRVSRDGALVIWQGQGMPPAGRPAEWPCKRLAVIVDLMEEEYRFERMPHLTGSDRRALWARKQRQLFQGEPYVSVMRLGRDKTGRRDDRVLFSAIRDSVLFRRWMDGLASWRIAVSGIWSLPRLTAEWRSKALENGMRVLIYRTGDKVALRQNYHHEGHLVFSRLSLVGEEVEGAQELERTWRYLARLFSFDSGQALKLQIWSSPEQFEMAQGFIEGLPDTVPEYIGLEEASVAMGWRRSGGVPDVPALASFSLVRRWLPRASHYRDPILHSWERRRWMWAACTIGAVLLFAVAGGYDTLMEGQILRLDEEMQRLRQQKRTLTTFLERLPEPEPVAGLDAWQLESLLALWQKVDRGRIHPAPVLELISWALDHFPTFELMAVEWRRFSPENEEPAEDGVHDLSRPPRLTVSLKVPMTGASIRKTVEQVRHFVDLLASHRLVAGAQLAASTIPIGNEEPITGELSTFEAAADSAMFTVMIDALLPDLQRDPVAQNRTQANEDQRK